MPQLENSPVHLSADEEIEVTTARVAEDDLESEGPPKYPIKEHWWKHKPDDVDLAITAGKTFVKKEWDIMRGFLDTFIETESKEKKTLLAEIILKVRCFWGNRFAKQLLDNNNVLKLEWHKKKLSICGYMRHRASRRTKFKLKGLSMRAPAATVIAHLYNDRIRKMMTERGDAEIGKWAKAQAAVRKQLTPAEWEEVETTQRQWEDMGVPVEVQKKTATTQGKRYCTLFDDFRWKRIGMRTLTLETHLNVAGERVYSIHDNGSRYRTLAGHSLKGFKEFDPAGAAAMEVAWCAYADYISKTETGKGVPQKEKPFIFEDVQVDSNSIPVVPAKGRKKALDLQQQICFFMNKHYALAKGVPKKKHQCPWGDIIASQGSETPFIGEEFLPPNFIIKEPSKYRKDECEELLRHWRPRDKAGDFGFRFSFLPGPNGAMLETQYPEPGTLPLPISPPTDFNELPSHDRTESEPEMEEIEIEEGTLKRNERALPHKQKQPRMYSSDEEAPAPKRRTKKTKGQGKRQGKTKKAKTVIPGSEEEDEEIPIRLTKGQRRAKASVRLYTGSDPESEEGNVRGGNGAVRRTQAGVKAAAGKPAIPDPLANRPDESESTDGEAAVQRLKDAILEIRQKHQQKKVPLAGPRKFPDGLPSPNMTHGGSREASVLESTELPRPRQKTVAVQSVKSSKPVARRIMGTLLPSPILTPSSSRPPSVEQDPDVLPGFPPLIRSTRTRVAAQPADAFFEGVEKRNRKQKILVEEQKRLKAMAKTNLLDRVAEE
ncbi:hypothetical protein CPB83DRAFT_892919 [Crepidotus variabilis]|uniref:Uncharacterized protein n=1 Tax=Crepidotus variabilis TaxID=179855 RepID=A0A9P6EIZ6_9AGAR|nr:hypothetical protein CPB83DRAFT_892919 [Crepidotus variabilis]